MTMPEFNEDLLLHIVDYLDKQDVKSLSTVCRYMCVIIQPVLFYKIQLSGKKQYLGFHKTIEYRQYRQCLESSPRFANYPRDVTLHVDGSDTQDMVVVLSALTGKKVRTISVIGKNIPPPNLPAPLENALITFFNGTALPLVVTLVRVGGRLASSIRSVEHLALVQTYLDNELNNCTVNNELNNCTVKTMRFVGKLWSSMDAFGQMKCLTHFMIDWVLPCEDPLEWYKELGASLVCMTKLRLLTVIFREGWGEAHDYVTAYASTIQTAIAPRRLSLEWRFLPKMESSVQSYMQCFGHLSGWHTIAFQFDIEHNAGTRQSMLWFVQNTLLNKDTDNYYVRIDEVFSPESWNADPESNRSTLFINRHAPQDMQSDAVEREIHEDVCPLRPSYYEQLVRPQTWTPCGRKWEIEKIWV